MPDVKSLRIPVQYLANMLTAGDTAPVVAALERMLAMRAYHARQADVDGVAINAIAIAVGLTAEVEDMYKIMAIAELRGPLRHPTRTASTRGGRLQRARRCGFSFGNGWTGMS